MHSFSCQVDKVFDLLESMRKKKGRDKYSGNKKKSMGFSLCIICSENKEII